MVFVDLTTVDYMGSVNRCQWVVCRKMKKLSMVSCYMGFQ
jgi:hypothetical protein